MYRQLMYRQLMLIGNVANLSSEDVVKQSMFEPTSCNIGKPAGPRRRGRPRNTWAHLVYKTAVAAAGNERSLLELWSQQRDTWPTIAKQFCFK